MLFMIFVFGFVGGFTFCKLDLLRGFTVLSLGSAGFALVCNRVDAFCMGPWLIKLCANVQDLGDAVVGMILAAETL
jgi:hypothetical protein